MKSHWSGKKFIDITQGFYRSRFLLHRYFFSFSLTNACLPCRFYAKRLLYYEQPTVLLTRRHLNTMLLTNFENLNSISNISQQTHDFLVLTDPVIICIYLKTTDRHFHDQGNIRHSTSNLIKWDLVQILNTFRTLLCEFLLLGRYCLLFFENF